MKKALIGIGIVVLLLIIGLVSIPFLFKDKINDILKQEINKNITARVNYSGFDLSIFHSFPDLTFTLNDFTAVCEDATFRGDTLARFKQFRITLDIMTVYRGEKYKIKELLLTEPMIHAEISKTKKANWDIAKKSSSSESKFSLGIKKYKIEQGDITYEDLPGGLYAHLKGFDFDGSGDVTQDLYQLSTRTAIQSLTYRSGAISYFNGVKIVAHNDIEVDQKNNKYTFKDNEIGINDLSLLFDGYLRNGSRDMDMDVKFKSKQAEFKSILSLIPAIYQKDFDKIKTNGKLSLDGRVNGTYSTTTMPALLLNLVVDNAMFQYPSLPTAVTGINIDAHIAKPQGGLDLTTIDISKLHLLIGTDPIDALIHIRRPISDPDVDAKIDARLNLANVPKLYPMEGLKQLTGNLVARLDFKGRMSDVQKKNYTAIHADGNASVTGLIYATTETPMPIHISDMKLTFNPQNVTLNNLQAVIGNSDFTANGALNNFMGYLFGKGDLEGNLNLKSNVFDANQWLAKDDAKTTTSTGKPQYFQVPKQIDFTANSSFGTIRYDKMQLTNVHGMVVVKDETIDLRNLSANLLGGSANISATYATKVTKVPKVNFSYDIQNFDIQQTYTQVGMSDKIAPVMKYIQGSFSSALHGSGSLKEDMSVDYATLTGDGKVTIPSAKIVGLPILQKIAEVTKISSLNNLTLTNAWTLMQFHDGRVHVDPTDLKFGNGYLLNMKGSNGFDQSVDYDLRFDVPYKELGSSAGQLINQIPKVPGVEFKMPETVNVFLKVGGSVSKPTVSISKIGAGGNSTKEIITQVVDQAKQKAEEEARKQAEVLKQKAADEAAKQADKLSKGVGDKVKDVVKGFKLPW